MWQHFHTNTKLFNLSTYLFHSVLWSKYKTASRQPSFVLQFLSTSAETLLIPSDLCNVSQWLFILHQHLSKLQALFWVDPHHIPEQKDPVWSVAHLEPKKWEVHLIYIYIYPWNIKNPKIRIWLVMYFKCSMSKKKTSVLINHIFKFSHKFLIQTNYIPSWHTGRS